MQDGTVRLPRRRLATLFGLAAGVQVGVVAGWAARGAATVGSVAAVGGGDGPARPAREALAASGGGRQPPADAELLAGSTADVPPAQLVLRAHRYQDRPPRDDWPTEDRAQPADGW